MRRLTGDGEQAEGQFAPGRDGRRSRRGGAGGDGGGGGGRRPRRHREAAVAGDLVEDLTAGSLGPQGADLRTGMVGGWVWGRGAETRHRRVMTR